MTIAIEGERDFEAAVLDALGEICGCDGAELLGGSEVAFTPGTDADCLCGHAAGCNLLRNLDAWSETVHIAASSGNSNTYNPGSRKVFWTPTTQQLKQDHDLCGGMTTSPTVMLAHELVHAHHDQLNKLQAGDAEEFATVRGENQLRLELRWPPRIEYGAPVPAYDTADIDGDGPGACRCDRFETRFQLLARFWGYGKIQDRCKDPSVAVANLAALAMGQSQAVGGAFQGMPHDPAYDALLQAVGDPQLADVIRFALARRAASPHFDDAQRLRKAVLASDRGFALEAVDLDGRHRIVSMRMDNGRVRLDTNLSLAANLPAERRRMFVGEDGELETPALPPGHDLPRPLLPFPRGVGGDAAVLDGTVHLLTVNDGDTVRDAIEYGYTRPAYHAVWDEPRGRDFGRWKAINGAYDYWRAALIAVGPGPNG